MVSMLKGALDEQERKRCHGSYYQRATVGNGRRIISPHQIYHILEFRNLYEPSWDSGQRVELKPDHARTRELLLVLCITQ